MAAPKAKSKPKPKPIMGGSADDLEMIVQVASDASIREVAKRLQKAGHLVERELPISGVIGVKAPRSDLGRIERMRGVKFVRIGVNFQASSTGRALD